MWRAARQPSQLRLSKSPTPKGRGLPPGDVTGRALDDLLESEAAKARTVPRRGSSDPKF